MKEKTVFSVLSLFPILLQVVTDRLEKNFTEKWREGNVLDGKERDKNLA